MGDGVLAEQRAQRRLAAILAADIVGYSRLMEVDEAGTLARVKALRTELLHPKVAEYGGRIVKTTGDGTLIEFPSAVDAVQHAVDVQGEMVRRNAGEPEGKRIVLRMGINLGDIIIDGDDIYGDGVNVAARLEGLAEAGGICISGTVHEHVRGKLDTVFDDMGEQSVKNIARPVHVYRVALGGPAGSAEREKPALPLPDKPSIAVLPFANMSGDPEQEYFADGIAEDIITALSRFRQFFVIARNSSFTYKGKPVDVRTVGRELGVRYVLEGSVRKGGNRLRITAQLVEAASGKHLWAEKYDGALEDVFDLQDRITGGVIGAIEPSVRTAEIERARRKKPESLDAYDLLLRALPHMWAYAPDENAKAVALLDKALEIDPNFTIADGYLAASYLQRDHWRALDPPNAQAAIRHARSVMASNTDDAQALAYAGIVFAMAGRDYTSARSALDQALALNPNDAQALGFSAAVHSVMGNLELAIDHAQRSVRMNPFDPLRCIPLNAAGRALYLSGRYEDTIGFANKANQANPRFLSAYMFLTASHVRLGQMEQARALTPRILAIVPNFSSGSWALNQFSLPEHRDAITRELRAAGLPE